MVNANGASRNGRGGSSSPDGRAVPGGDGHRVGPARMKLVNCGQDTQITLADGSTIVLKGRKQVDGNFLG